MLPEGHPISSNTVYGSSLWSGTSRIDVCLADGAAESYFIKVCLTLESTLEKISS